MQYQFPPRTIYFLNDHSQGEYGTLRHRVASEETTVDDLIAEILGEGERPQEHGRYGITALRGVRTVEEIMLRFSLDHVKARRILAAIELGKRLFDRSSGVLPLVYTPEDIVAHAQKSVQPHREEVHAVFISRQFRLLHDELLGIGSPSEVPIRPMDLYGHVGERGAHGVIIYHNHPSGSAEPTEADLQTLERLKATLALMETPLLDFVIITADNFWSAADASLLVDR